MNSYLLSFLNMLLASFIFILHDHQTGDKTSGNDLPGKNGNDENGRNEKGDKI